MIRCFTISLLVVALTVGCKPEPVVDDTPKTLLGAITVNGETIDPDLFIAWAEEKLYASIVCPPVSDPFVRDQVLKRVLGIAEAERRNLTRHQSALDKIQKQQAIVDKGFKSEKKLRAAKLDLLFRQYGAYESQLMPYIDYPGVEAEYKLAIEEKHPKFVDVDVIRFYKVLMVRGTEMGDAVFNALQDDEPVEEVIQKYKLATTEVDISKTEHNAQLDFPTDQWFEVHHSYQLKRKAEPLNAGDTVGPYNFGPYAVYEKVIEKRTYPVLELGKQYPGIDWDLENRLRLLAGSRQRIAFVGQIFDEADIKEDGVVVENHVLPRAHFGPDRPSCPSKH